MTERHPGNRDILLKVFGENGGTPWPIDGYDWILVADFVFDWLSRHLKADDAGTGRSRPIDTRL
ncbi:MAG: hypothetical protein QM576_13670 [Rhodopseudomonas sp.]|uniref:hypothetical protein n=1 Tax=Rhodopseudomonas sp. TaxID=1078 RepID=UPI0039E3B205